jgi:class 3 adenylate cyclase
LWNWIALVFGIIAVVALFFSAKTADERAARLLLEAEQAKLALERLKTPRTLAPERQQFVVNAISAFKGQRYTAAISQSADDGLAFWESLYVTLERAGWIYVPLPIGSPGMGNPLAGVPIAAMPGIEIRMDPAKETQLTPPALALGNALHADGTVVAVNRDNHVFNTAGDAILAEFSSAVEAVRCATEIQAALRTRNDQLLSERQVNFRIGVNVGDVMVQGGDLLGDGINVAARLQAVAEPGGICVSGSVYDQALNKLSLSFKPLGELNYRNLPQPVRTFAIAKVAGLGVLPSPARRHLRVNGWRRRRFLIVILILIAAGGIFWLRSHRVRNPAEYTPTAEFSARLRALADQRRIEREAHRLAKADRRIGDDEALAAPEAGPTDPLSSPPAAATPTAATPGDDASGLYRGQICFGKIEALPSRCFKAQGVITNNKISGQWPSVVPGSTVYLAGDVTHTGQVAIRLNSQRADGSRGGSCRYGR